jgi:N-acylneuraminate cytidylyltransferase
MYIEQEPGGGPSAGGKRVLAVITARGGSKGLPRKNVLPAGGRPLIAWTIGAALESEAIGQVVLSSDDDEIIETAKAWGCEVPFRRPAELASDTATSMDVLMHALDQLPGYDYVVLLQPTSPLRTAADIDAALALLESRGAPSCVSVCEAEQSPYWMFRLADGDALAALLPGEAGASRRQDLPPVYVLNGAIYIARIDWLRRTKSFLGDGCIAYRMPAERSVDIDTAADFEAFRRMVEAS